MHDNVDIAKELQETRQLFNSVLLTQSQKSSGGGGKKGDETLLEIAKDILSKVSYLFLFLPLRFLCCWYSCFCYLISDTAAALLYSCFCFGDGGDDNDDNYDDGAVMMIMTI